MKVFFKTILCLAFLLSNSVSGMDYVLSLFKPVCPQEAAITAIRKGSLIEFKDAISKGADITQKQNSYNLLMRALVEQRSDIALYLMQNDHFKKPDIINQCNKCGQTALMFACGYKYAGIVKGLLAIEGLDINAQDYHGETALHYAFKPKYPNVNIVELLINNGANSTLVDSYGLTIAFAGKGIAQMDAQLKEKILYQVDSQGDTHLHLLAKARVAYLARKCYKTINECLPTLFLTKFMWMTNDNGELSVDKAYVHYNKLKQLYSEEKVDYLQKALNDQEQLFHTFLIHYAADIKSKSSSMVSVNADEFNIETIIAQRYKDNEKYYSVYSISWKNSLREELRKDMTQIPQVWISGYIPPQVIEEPGIVPVIQFTQS